MWGIFSSGEFRGENTSSRQLCQMDFPCNDATSATAGACGVFRWLDGEKNGEPFRGRRG